MARLTRNNCTVDPHSGGVIFHGSPEFQEIMKLREEIQNLHTKLDKLIELIEGGVQCGRKVEHSRFSSNNGQEVQ